MLNNKNYIHISVFPTKPNNEIHGGKNVFQKKCASLVIGGDNLDLGYRAVNCGTGIVLGGMVSYSTEDSYRWTGKFSKKCISKP